MKKTILIFISILIFKSNSIATSGIPVFDAGSIAQAIKSFEQMQKEYQQMLKDTANFEKQMTELGVNMSSVNEILGSANSLISQTQSLYNGIVAIPETIFDEVEDITRACNFLNNNSNKFGIKLRNSYSKYTNKASACIASISDFKDIDEDINEIIKKMNVEKDEKKYNELAYQVQTIKKARDFVKEKANQDKANKLIAFYDNFEKNEKNNPYSREKMNNDLKELSRQLLKPNNQKQAQALTNSILIKILEMGQKQYELNVYMSQAIQAISNQGKESTLNDSSFNQAFKNPTEVSNYNPFYQDIKEFPKDEMGMPIWGKN
ncbi:hypothetical protein FTT16_08720 [Campylobacter jejuni]|nr:hypothetical protein [Campylobacter jejuni]